MAVRDKQIDPAVVVVIEKLRAPADVRQTHRRDLRGVRKIGERVFAVVMIKRVVFVGEVGDEDVELAVVIVVAGGHAHAALLAAVFIDRGARSEPDLFKRAVAFVAVMKIRRRVVGDEDIDQAVVVEVAGEHAEAVITVRVRRRRPLSKRR